MFRQLFSGLAFWFAAFSHLRYLERSVSSSLTETEVKRREHKPASELQMLHALALFCLEGLVLVLGILLSLPLVVVLMAACLLLIVYLPMILSRSRKEEEQFLAEYAPLLLSTAANLKTGLAAVTALSEASNLLPINSRLREEVSWLIGDLRGGVPIEQAMACFAPKMTCPEIGLLRLLLPVALQHGGRFAPSLERLARLCEERRIMIEEARASTASMRFTAAILLGAAPLFLMLLSIRDDDFWAVMFGNHLAGNLAGVGLMIITLSYLVLRQMADFRP